MKALIAAFFFACLIVASAGAADAPVAATAANDVTELKFADMFVLPVGPRGLTPSAKLLSLIGHTVQLTGYVASVERPTVGRLILVPLPVALGDEDEGLSDDLPASATFVHLSGAEAARALPFIPGLVRLVGTLEVGALEEPDGRVSSVRLRLDDPGSRRLVEAAARATPSRQPKAAS